MEDPPHKSSGAERPAAAVSHRGRWTLARAAWSTVGWTIPAVLQPTGAESIHVSLAQDFSVESTFGPGRVVVTIRGELDAASTPRLRDALAPLSDDPGIRCVVVNVAGLTFIDSAGIHTLVEALKRFRGRGGDLALSGVNPGAYKVLDVCGMTSVFSMAGDSSS